MGITAFPFTAVIDVPTACILGRDDAGTGSAEALTNTEIFAILGTGTPSASTYLRGDGTWAAVSAGISSLNGLTDATQTFAAGTTGTDVAWVSADGVHTLNIPDASATARGLVTTGTQAFNGNKTFNNSCTFDVITCYQIEGNQRRSGIHQSRGFVSAYSHGAYKWTGGGTIDSLPDLYLERDDADIMAQRRSANAQRFRVYNTYTSSTSYERLSINWSSNVCTITTEKGSAGGTLRGLRIGDAATALVGFYGVTPVDQPATITDPTGGGTVDAEARTAIEAIIDRLQELGLIA